MEASTQRPLQSLYFSSQSGNKDDRPGLWFAQTYSTSLKPRNGISQNLTGNKISTTFTFYFNVFLADRKSKIAALASDWLKHFRLFLCNLWIEFNEWHVLYQVCVLQADDSRPGLNVLRHFWLLCLTEVNEIVIWLVGCSTSHSTIFCFINMTAHGLAGRLKKLDLRSGWVSW